MKDFVYPIKDIFLEDALLKELSASKYFVASYQRGYKWKSFGKNDQVPLLLTDTYEAFLSGSSEYYLQYITVKKNDENPEWLEVIDGQQRLTTLSLFFYIAESFTVDGNNIAKGKVVYERHGEDHDIFDTILELATISQEAKDERLKKKQDIYYMYHACECIKVFFSQLNKDPAAKVRYLDYFNQKVKIIINLEESTASAEDVFSNLNDNKVELTDEFLIKGLLFTKAARGEKAGKTFSEIQDLRSRIAYKWDEIDNWFRQEAHVEYFRERKTNPQVGKKIGVGILLDLLRPVEKSVKENNFIESFIESLNSDPDRSGSLADTTHELFNAYNDMLITWEEIHGKLSEVMNLSKRLKNWYYDNEIHALLGYYLLNGQSLGVVMNLSTKTLKEKLYSYVLESCLVEDVTKLNYLNDRKRLELIFSALNIFRLVRSKDGIVIDSTRRFDFISFKRYWTLEHIYPQDPRLKVVDDLIDFKPWFEKYLNKLKEIPDSRDRGLELLELLEGGDKEKLAKRLENFNIILELGDIDVHSIGNLALLERGDNSSMSNHIFPHKRRRLLERINAGSFVPQHTIGAITKYLRPIGQNYSTGIQFDEVTWDWTDKDCQANAKWISQTHKELLYVLKTKVKVSI